MSSTWGNHIKISIFGESHSKGIGIVIDGVPAGTVIDFSSLLLFMARRSSKGGSAGNGYSGLLPNGTGVTSIIWTLLSKTMKAKQRTAITSRNTIFPPPCYTGC